jgi:hypothetical protein
MGFDGGQIITQKLQGGRGFKPLKNGGSQAQY